LAVKIADLENCKTKRLKKILLLCGCQLPIFFSSFHSRIKFGSETFFNYLLHMNPQTCDTWQQIKFFYIKSYQKNFKIVNLFIGRHSGAIFSTYCIFNYGNGMSDEFCTDSCCLRA